MAICLYCNREMNDGVSCSKFPVFFPDGLDMAPVPYLNDENCCCHGCFTPVGGFHHPGCDVERCPKCGDQLISCGCKCPKCGGKLGQLISCRCQVKL